MPSVDLVFYQEEDGSVPVLDWFAALPDKAKDKCRVKLERLKALGHEMRRPEADYLKDGIYELRFKVLHLNYRILYFFHHRNVAVLSHALVKEREVPLAELRRAFERRNKFELDPPAHKYHGG